MVVASEQDLTAAPLQPRTLRTVKGARLELARLYHQTEAGVVEPIVAGKLSHILGLLITSYRDHELIGRIEVLEGIAQQPGRKPNGHHVGPRP